MNTSTDNLNTVIDENFLKSLVDFDAANERVRSRLATLESGEMLVRFFTRYASWNGKFANGVAALTSMIGSNREMFREAGFPRAASDRSNYIASFVFSAAVDEYDDRRNPIRDTHRCMAQAELIGMNAYFGLDDSILDEEEPVVLREVNDAVDRGYDGRAYFGADSIGRVFAGIGYHLGSELLADEEFSILDKHLRAKRNELVQHLMRSTVRLAGGEHRCYAWVGVHSGGGEGVEADHFQFALSGVVAALGFLVGGERAREIAIDALVSGFKAFEADHGKFFGMSAVA